jgi:3-hydroxybutyryl-CoA dehydratase
MNITNYSVGQSEKISKSFSQEDVEKFAELSLDINPIHLNKEYARNTIFGNTIVHGFLYGSLISAVIGNQLPGPGAIYLNQELNFKIPVYKKEVVTATVTVKDINIERSILYLDTVCTKNQNEIVIVGKAVIKII